MSRHSLELVRLDALFIGYYYYSLEVNANYDVLLCLRTDSQHIIPFVILQ